MSSQEKDRTKAQRLMALALGTPYSEEARTAAVEALKLIAKHEMLGLSGPPAPVVKAQLAEIERLKAQVEELRRERVAPPKPAVPTSFAVLDLVNHLREIESLKREVARLQALPRVGAPRTIATARALPRTVHEVRPGESPTQIARAYTGNPARLPELVAANPQKPRIGRTFATLRVGERLRLPIGW